MPKPAVKSLFSFRWGRGRVYLLPLRGLAYAAISLAVVAALLLFIDRVVLGTLERGGWTAGEMWRRNNQLVEENHRRKTLGDVDGLRQWRGEPLPAAASTGERPTILVLGDSFVFGPPYPTLNQLWWRQLAIELERRGYRQVQVLAAGRSGWSTHDQLQRARTLIPEIKPDLVLWGYVTNDPDEKLVPQIADRNDRGPLPHRVRMQLKALLPNLMFKFESLRADKLATQYAGPKYGYRYFEWEQKLLEGDNFARYRETVAALGKLLGNERTPGVMITLPGWPCREHYEPRYAPVLPLWRSAGVAACETLEPFLSRYGNAPQNGPEAIRWGINPADSHPGPRATHFHAVMAADYLEQHHAELLGPKDAARPHELAINDWLPFDLNVRPHGAGEFLLDYPATTQFMPTLPLDVPTALVALRYPLSVNEIRISGAGLRGVRVWISTLHPAENYDECQWRELPRASGGEFSFRLPADLAGCALTTVRFSADVVGASRELTLTLVPAAGEQP